jgi:hypothetical protein
MFIIHFFFFEYIYDTIEVFLNLLNQLPADLFKEYFYSRATSFIYYLLDLSFLLHSQDQYIYFFRQSF